MTVELMKIRLLCVTRKVDVAVAMPLFSFTVTGTVTETVCLTICVVVAKPGAVIVVVTYAVTVTAAFPPVGNAVVVVPPAGAELPPPLAHFPNAA